MKRQIIPTLAGLIILCALGWYVDQIAHEELVQVTRIVIYTLAATVTITAIGVAFFLILSVRERLLTRQAQRQLIQRDAEVQTIISDTHGVFVREMNPQAVWRPLHLNPTTYQNGQHVEVLPVEYAAWQTWTLRNRPSAMKTMEPILLPAQTQIELLPALDSVQRCLIVGASDTGKTTLLQHLVVRRAQLSKVIVIDPHSYPHKWPNCMVIGTGRNYADIDRALAALVQLMTKRYDEIGKGVVGEGSHPRLTILIDEWRAIIQNVKAASGAIKALLTESRKAAMSVFVATHSERAKPLGLEGEYDLKDGFAIIRLSNINGQRLATLDTGTGAVPVALPGPYPSNGLAATDDDPIIDLEAEPTPTEQQILGLYAEGASYANICETVWGYRSSNKYPEIDAVLEKFKAK
jgi:hypothetical protein